MKSATGRMWGWVAAGGMCIAVCSPVHADILDDILDLAKGAKTYALAARDRAIEARNNAAAARDSANEIRNELRASLSHLSEEMRSAIRDGAEDLQRQLVEEREGLDAFTAGPDGCSTDECEPFRARLMDLLEIEPERVAHDLHPDVHGTRFAADFARQRNLKSIAVQHHHAHIAAVAAEHRADGPLLGLALDGVGTGTDKGIWGGELLAVDRERFDRLGHLRELALPGGDKAAREPWRMAAAALFALGRGGEIKARFPQQRAAGAIAMMLGGNAHTPPTSSCGRLFDAAAGLAGLREIAAYEGQAAMLYESQSAQHGEVEAMKDGFVLGEDNTLDLLPLLARLADEREAGFAAALFHATLAEALAAWVQRAAQESGIARVALGGGCFLNRILSEGVRRRLEAKGFDVLVARLAPPNDGGLSLGQAWVAMNA